jgi:hypothetical protein
MKIDFENGSSIESIETNTSTIRSKRAEEYLKYFRSNPYWYVEAQGIKLHWYQKLMLKILYKRK